MSINDFNQVILIGRLGKDPEEFSSEGKNSFVKIDLATNKSWKKDNEVFKDTQWHVVVFNYPLAEAVLKIAKQGDKAFIRGELKTRKWQDKNGVNHQTTEIYAKEFILLGSKSSSEDDITADLEESQA